MKNIRLLSIAVLVVLLAVSLTACVGDGGDSNSGTAPLAPTGVTATAGDGQVSISWRAVSGATSYNIYWATISSVTKTTGTKIAGATSSYSHTGLTNDTTYYYIITAVNSSGESVESPQVSAMPTGPPTEIGSIAIQNDDQFTRANGVVSGSGTEADPYIIEGWTIDFLYDAIAVSSTSKYFVIRNCQIKSNSDGISLSSLSNGRVENCVLRECGNGIRLENCSNIVLSGNNIESCSSGITNSTDSTEEGSDGVTISNNTITGSTHKGIELRYLINSSVTGNISRNNGNSGIDMFRVSACTVSDNTCTGNSGSGIHLSPSESSTCNNNDTSNNVGGIVVSGDYNTISYNTSNGNTYTGLDIANGGGVKYSTVSNNTANNNGTVGILACNDATRNSVISNNTCLSNSNYDISIYWDYSSIGNTFEGNVYGTLNLQHY